MKIKDFIELCSGVWVWIVDANYKGLLQCRSESEEYLEKYYNYKIEEISTFDGMVVLKISI